MNDTVEIGFVTGKTITIENVNDRHADGDWYYFWTDSGTTYDIYAPNVTFVYTSPSRPHSLRLDEMFNVG